MALETRKQTTSRRPKMAWEIFNRKTIQEEASDQAILGGVGVS